MQDMHVREHVPVQCEAEAQGIGGSIREIYGYQDIFHVPGIFREATGGIYRSK
jgi:hypothetical protein